MTIKEEFMQHIGLYSTFKEARKHARELARLRHSYAYITKVDKGFEVQMEDYNFTYYVHLDGRVCKRETLEKERAKWARHPEQQSTAYPFGVKLENRRKDEDKKAYKERMSVFNRYEK